MAFSLSRTGRINNLATSQMLPNLWCKPLEWTWKSVAKEPLRLKIARSPLMSTASPPSKSSRHSLQPAATSLEPSNSCTERQIKRQTLECTPTSALRAMKMSIGFSCLNENVSLRLEYRSSKATQDLCTDVLVSLVIHPGHQIGTVYIKTSQLHVGFEDDLGWSVDNLTSHTDYGMIRLNDNNPSNFLANTLSLSAVDGYVTGRFGPASNLHLKSESGAIGGFACRTQESKTSSFKRYRCTQKVER